MLCGLFKVHETKKVRDEAKELIVRHGGEKTEKFLVICGKRSYISMGNDDKPKKDLLALEKVDGFDVEAFAYVLVAKKNISKFYLMTKESVWAKMCIEKYINTKDAYGWLRIEGKASSHFILADKSPVH